MAASTRPQFGSLPNSAHLSRLLRAMLRPTFDRVVLCRWHRRSRCATSLVAPSASGEQLRGQVAADLREQRGGEVGRRGQRRRTLRWPAAARCRWWTCSRRRRPGRMGSAPRGSPQRLVGRWAAFDLRVGGDDAQHRGQPRGEHAGALGHAADGPACPVCATALLGNGVGGADRLLRGERSAVVHGPPRPRRRRPAAGPSAAARRSVRWSRRRPRPPTPYGARRPLGGAVGVGEPVRPGAGVGAAGVQHDRPQPAALEHLLRPEHRGGLHPVAGEDPGGDVRRAVVDHQSHVRVSR